MQQIQESVILVNEQDEEVGTEEKLRAHELGLLHRAFSVFIFKQQAGERHLLLQQRQHNKYHAANLWTNTCCSHPRLGEPIITAAERRLHEEMSIRAHLTNFGYFRYTAHFKNGLIENELDYVCVGKYPEGCIIQMDPVEVQAYRWIAPGALKQALIDHPEQYTPWLSAALQVVLDQGDRLQEILCCNS